MRSQLSIVTMLLSVVTMWGLASCANEGRVSQGAAPKSEAAGLEVDVRAGDRVVAANDLIGKWGVEGTSPGYLLRIDKDGGFVMGAGCTSMGNWSLDGAIVTFDITMGGGGACDPGVTLEFVRPEQATLVGEELMLTNAQGDELALIAYGVD